MVKSGLVVLNGKTQQTLLGIMDLIHTASRGRSALKKKKKKKKKTRKIKGRRSLRAKAGAHDESVFERGVDAFMETYIHEFDKLGLRPIVSGIIQHMTIGRFRNIFKGISFRETVVRDLLLYVVYTSAAGVYTHLNTYTRETLPGGGGAITSARIDSANRASRSSPWNMIIYTMMSTYFDTHSERKLISGGNVSYYRGDTYNRNLSVGDTMIVESFWSSSDNINVAHAFSGAGVVYTITDEANIMPYPLCEISEIVGETEYLFPPGTIFSITSSNGGLVRMKTMGICVEYLQPILRGHYEGFISKTHARDCIMIIGDDGDFHVNRRPQNDYPIALPLNLPQAVAQPAQPAQPAQAVAQAPTMITWDTLVDIVAVTVATVSAIGLMSSVSSLLGASKKQSRKRKKRSRKRKKRRNN